MSLGLVSRACSGCRCAMGIAAGRVAWVALCHADCVSRGCRCAMGIAGRAVLEDC